MERYLNLLLKKVLEILTGKTSGNDTIHYNSFYATIKEIHNDAAIVEAEDGSIPSGEVSIDLSVNRDETFQVGAKVFINYFGPVLESYPAQVQTVCVEKVQ